MSFLLPDWAHRAIGHSASSRFRIHSSSADGHCFFDSIRQILSTVGLDRSVDRLRQIVARPGLEEKDEIVNSTIANWLALYQGASSERDQQLLEEYKHMAVLKDATLPLSMEYRKLLYDTMLTDQYWGEHHACRIIEEQTQMRFLIFCDDIQAPQLTWYHSTQFKPTHYCFLFLRRQHYMPVSWDNRFIFQWNDIPYAVQLFLSRAYSQPKPVEASVPPSAAAAAEGHEGTIV